MAEWNTGWPWLDQPTPPSFPRYRQGLPLEPHRGKGHTVGRDDLAFPPGPAERTEPGVCGSGQQEAGGQGQPGQAFSA